MNKRHYEHTLPNIRGSLSNTYHPKPDKKQYHRQIHNQFHNINISKVKILMADKYSCFYRKRPASHSLLKKI